MEFELFQDLLNKKQQIELTKSTTKPDTRKLLAQIIANNRDLLQTYTVGDRPDKRIQGLYIKDTESGLFMLVRQEATRYSKLAQCMPVDIDKVVQCLQSDTVKASGVTFEGNL